MKLIGLLVLLALVSLVEGEVIDSFAYSCPACFNNNNKKKNNGFFSGFFELFMNNDNPVFPTVLQDQNKPDRYKQICQRKDNKYSYATLYDTHNRIPVYSAYQYTGYTKLARGTKWNIEPQLDGYSGTEMTTQANAGGPVGEFQAVNEDYSYSGYQKGHVYPHSHNSDQDQAYSTFTLTNAAPQEERDNKRWYNLVENEVNKAIRDTCSQNSALVVTGVIPGTTFMKGNRVNIPSFFWSAYLGRDKNNQNRFMSEGFMLEMTGNGEGQAIRGNIAWLNHELTKRYETDFQVFGTVVTHCSGCEL